jgi:hypothetical protein
MTCHNYIIACVIIVGMNTCPNCDHELVNVLYGFPSPKMIEMARNEDIALGGCTIVPDMPTHYCYGCHEAFVF